MVQNPWKSEQSSLIFESSVISGIRDEMISVFNGFTNHFGPSAALKYSQGGVAR